MLQVFVTCVAAIATAASAARATAPSAPTDAPASGQQEFRAARVEIVGFHEAAVLAGLRLRLPRLPIERHGGSTPDGSPYVYLAIVRTADDAGLLRAITSDGRAYERGFAVEIGQEVRVAASTAVSLLFAIEEGALAPNRNDVAIPEAPIDDSVEPPIVAAPAQSPVLAPPIVTPAQPVDRPAPAPVKRWELAAAVQGAASLGLGPPRHASAFAGAGGGLGLELRSPRGAAAALELRGLGRGDSGLGVGRLRVAVAGGYALRRGRFELPMLFALTVEPWWTTRSGAAVAVFSGDTQASRPPLLGALLRVTPALRVAPRRGPLVGLRFGPRFELGGAFVVDGGARIVGLQDLDGTPRFRLGGLEISLGLELALQFALP